jgi:hypothetical protein
LQEFSVKNKMAVVPHPPYSPDLAPRDVLLSPKAKIKSKGRRFDTFEETQAETQTALNALTRKEVAEALGSEWALPRGYLEGGGAE